MTFTRLRVGTKSFRTGPPRLGPPCENLLVLDETISDPGVENQIANHTGGPNGDEIPTYVTGGPVWESDDSPVGSGAIPGWIQGPPAADAVFGVVTANPRSGSTHLRLHDRDGTKALTDGTQCSWAHGNKQCGNTGSWIFTRHSARCDPGHLVTWSGYFTGSDIGATPPEVTLTLTFKKQDGSFNAQVNVNLILTTSYVQVIAQSVAPASSYFCTVEWAITKGTETSGFYDGDDFSLVVA